MDFSAAFRSLVSNLPWILVAVFVFGVIIFVHELGHFLAAKWARIKVNEFAMGMGPTILKKVKGDTAYAIRLFPIGGFVAMEGENDESDDNRAFCNAPVFKRMVVSFAGSVMNLLLGLVLLIVLSSGQALFGSTVVAAFNEGSVSSEWLEVGDKILKVNGHSVRTDNDLIYEFTRDRDGVMDFLVERQGNEVLLKDVRFNMEELEGGIKTIMLDFKVQGIKPTPLRVIGNAFNWTNSVIKQVWGSFLDLVTGRYGFNQLSGPVGVTSVIVQATKLGFDRLLYLMAIITVNLGVFNMLPLPALDGGRLIFQIIEAVRRKPVNPKYEGAIHAVGFLLLIGLMIAVTVSDVAKQL